MARYREKILPPVPTLFFLAFAFLIAFAPWTLGERDLSWREGYIVVQSMDMVFTPLPLVMAHGEAVPNAYPLFPMLAKVAALAGCPAELTTRTLSLLGALGLAILVFAVTAATRKNISAGACAAAIIISSLLMIDRVPDGFSTTLFTLVIFSGHLLWYYLAAVRGDWAKAWLAGFIACAAGFYMEGVISLIFFLLPLIFMRRPLGIFRRLRNRGVVLGIAIVVLIAMLWYLPYHFEGVRSAVAIPRFDMLDTPEYLWHLASFPCDLTLRLFPWLLLAWAPFCVAFQTLDDTPMFSRFLRTLFLANFFLIWIIPLDEVRVWIILIPPLAVMTGLNYELTVRRYGNFLRKLGNIFAAVLLPGAGILLLGFFLLPSEMIAEVMLLLERPLDFSDNFGRTVLGAVSGAALLLLALRLWQMREKPPIWCYYVIIALAPLLVYYNIVQPYQNQERPRYERGEILKTALLQDGAENVQLIYKYNIHDLFGESVYMNKAVCRINSLGMLPQAEVQTVYLLAPSFPDCAERNWRSLLAQPLAIRGYKFNLWRGDWKGNKTKPEPKLSPLLEVLAQDPVGKAETAQ